jgi:hypothetical protein
MFFAGTTAAERVVTPRQQLNHWRTEKMTTSIKTTKTGLTISSNHSRAGLKVRSAVKAGGLSSINHSRAGLKVRSAVKAGGLSSINHSRAGLKVRSAVKAGGLSSINHSRALR